MKARAGTDGLLSYAPPGFRLNVTTISHTNGSHSLQDEAA